MIILNKKIELNAGHYLVLIITVLLIYFSTKDLYIKNKVKNEGKQIVVKFTSKIRLPKTTKFGFTYYINGKKEFTYNSGVKYSILNSDETEKNIDNLKLNCFYIAKYIYKYSDMIAVEPTKQITDTIVILNAGFTEDEL